MHHHHHHCTRGLSARWSPSLVGWLERSPCASALLLPSARRVSCCCWLMPWLLVMVREPHTHNMVKETALRSKSRRRYSAANALSLGSFGEKRKSSDDYYYWHHYYIYSFVCTTLRIVPVHGNYLVMMVTTRQPKSETERSPI